MNEQDAYSNLGSGLETLRSKPSLASLVLIAHATSSEHLSVSFLVSFFPIILTSLQANVALDTTLATLLKVLCVAPLPQTELSPDIIIPLTTILPPLCSAHPDAPTRHVTFRILGRVLQLAPSVLSLQILRDLVSPSEDVSPYMRTAAIGLIKEAVLEALSCPKAENVFASPLLLQTIGPHVFRLDPPDLLTSFASIEELKSSPEPARLVECLNLYYILLLRDVNNRVRVFQVHVIAGLREIGAIRQVLGILEPRKVYNRPSWRQYARHWAIGALVSQSPYMHGSYSFVPLFQLAEALPLAAWQISLQRVEDALKTLT